MRCNSHDPLLLQKLQKSEDQVERKHPPIGLCARQSPTGSGCGWFPGFSAVGRGSPRNRVFTNDHHGPWSREAGEWQEIHLALYQPRDFVLQQKRPRIHAPRSISSFPTFDFFCELRYIRFLWTIN
jgi:hypothetical protein